ncbi:MAG: hypothetical protein AB1757_18660 [Acidobacteriota bacterium]
MIRYKVTKAKLEQLVEAEAAGWLNAAKTKVEKFRQLQKYEEAQGTWSEIKNVYMVLQRGKCAYCERKLEGGELGKIEHDVEHFRPKSKVRAWPTAKIKQDLQLNYSFTTGNKADVGYYLLSYNIRNYATTCKVCNSTCKSDYFPIFGTARFVDSDNFIQLKTEKPCLLYPIGSLDTDPEKIITFQGILPIPKGNPGSENYLRAQVTIDFFRLAVTREDLLRERALIIKSLYIAFLNKDNPNPLFRDDAQLTIDLALSETSPHTNCARSFYAVCEKDIQLAQQYYQAAVTYLKSKGF